MKVGMIFVYPLRVRSLPLFIAKDKSNVNFNASSVAVIQQFFLYSRKTRKIEKRVFAYPNIFVPSHLSL